VVEKNPIIDYAKFIVFGYYGKMNVTINGVSNGTERTKNDSTINFLDFIIFLSVILEGDS
jgi:hypothetical protein